MGLASRAVGFPVSVLVLGNAAGDRSGRADDRQCDSILDVRPCRHASIAGTVNESGQRHHYRRLLTCARQLECWALDIWRCFLLSTMSHSFSQSASTAAGGRFLFLSTSWLVQGGVGEFRKEVEAALKRR